MEHEASPLGLISFLSFAFSIIAAVLAIDMYKLLRTGEFGKTWRLLIIASVMFALLQVLRMAEILNMRELQIANLSQVVELCFVIVLGYAFYVQRQVFTHENKRPHNSRATDKVNFEQRDLDETDFDEPRYPLSYDEDEETGELHWHEENAPAATDVSPTAR